MVNVFGISNKIDSEHFLFFWDMDNIAFHYQKEKPKSMEYDALEFANLISQIGEIDIDVLESSKNSFHLVSYDIIPKWLLLMLNHLVDWECDYLSLDELLLYRGERAKKHLEQVLRLGEKIKKSSPKFLKRFYGNKNNVKSAIHYNFYRIFCNIPMFDIVPEYVFVKPRILMYKAGIGARRKNHSYLWHRILSKMKKEVIF